jgi:hypothetical protein
MAGLVPAIHTHRSKSTRTGVYIPNSSMPWLWMAGTSPAMTIEKGRVEALSHPFSRKLSITFFSPAFSNVTVSLLPSTAFTAP